MTWKKATLLFDLPSFLPSLYCFVFLTMVMLPPRFLLWGPAAVEHHKACKSLGPSLWQQPSGEGLLALLEPDRMLSTVAHFPQNRRIIPSVDPPPCPLPQ